MRYSEDVIEAVRNANDIVDVIGQYVKLTKKGANYFGLCPFHGEKTPSFSVSPQKQIYYCFGCGAGGNVLSFLMEYENYSFTEALKVLAERAHITLPEASSGGEDRSLSEKRMKLLEINRTAALFFYEQLKTDAGRIGYQYFREKRRLSDATITHFGLGFAPKSQDALYRHLKERGYSDELLSESGLVFLSEKGARDKFWNRVMFPIMDVNNRVVGFGGRVMGDGMPKYLNSPETILFDKSRNLYGLNFARKSRRNFLLLCEGYMDVIALHQAGFTNAVASLGTAFNEKHAQLLKRYTGSVILTQDNDDAGVRAKLRAFPILKDAGLNVRVLDTSDSGCKDPDEFLRKYGPDEYESYIRKAKNAFLFEIDVLRRGYQFSDPAEVTAFYNETADRLCGFSEDLERDNYVRAVSMEQQIPYEELKSLVDRKMLKRGGRAPERQEYDPDRAYRREEAEREEKKERQKTGEPHAGREARPHGAAGAGRPSALLKSERLLLSWFCEEPFLIGRVGDYLHPEDFSEGIYREIAEAIYEGSRAGKISAAAIMDSYAEDQEARKLAGAILNADATHRALSDMSVPDKEKAVTEAVVTLRRAALEQEIARAGADLKKLQTLLAEKTSLEKLHIDLSENQ
ncbi:MAG: DNA primase [Eubacteriales bacterium]|nr:DNA primase [Eubacteriales bacterium]